MRRKENMALKRNGKTVAPSAIKPTSNEAEPFEIKENVGINSQIDGYIKANAKQWAFIKSLPRERLERAVVWEKIRYNEQRQKLDRAFPQNQTKSHSQRSSNGV